MVNLPVSFFPSAIQFMPKISNALFYTKFLSITPWLPNIFRLDTLLHAIGIA